MPTTIAATADSLSRHAVAYNSNIQQALRAGLECETAFSARLCDNTYSAPNAVSGEVIQQYQPNFTPKNQVTFDADEWKLRKIKIDVQFDADELEKHWDSWMVNWHEIGLDPMVWTYPRYIYEQILLPKIIEEMNNNAMNGEYAAPTTDVAGVSINSVDGYIKNFQDGVAGGSIVEVATGDITAANAVDRTEFFCDNLPELYKDLPGTIYVSKTVERFYGRDYRGLFGTGNGVSGNENNDLRVDYTGKRIVGLHCLSGSKGMIFVPNTRANLIWGSRRAFPTMPVMRWESIERIVKGLCEFYRFYGYEWGQEVFINDQFTQV